MSSGLPKSTSEATESTSKSSTRLTGAASERDLPTPDDFQLRLGGIVHGREIRETLAFCRDIYEREADREASFESKATTLMGFDALAAAFVSGFAALLLDEATAPCRSVVQVLAFAYALLVSSFSVSIFCALKALWPHEIAAPHPEDILNLAGDEPDLATVRRTRAGDFYESYFRNHDKTNRKAEWVKRAQLCMLCGMVLLMVIAAVLSTHLVFS